MTAVGRMKMILGNIRDEAGKPVGDAMAEALIDACWHNGGSHAWTMDQMANAPEGEPFSPRDDSEVTLEQKAYYAIDRIQSILTEYWANSVRSHAGINGIGAAKDMVRKSSVDFGEKLAGSRLASMWLDQPEP